MIFHQGNLVPTTRPDSDINHFRTLCEVNDKLCVINSKHSITFGAYKRLLKAHEVKEALYLDGGTGWNHSWYRGDNGKAVVIAPKSHYFCTNWITFYR